MICNFTHTPFVRHLIQMYGETCCGKSVAKHTEINPMFGFEYGHFVYSYHKTITDNLFSAPKQRKRKIRMVSVWSK